MHKIPVGISSCLIGENVRFDGGHKSDSYIVGTLGEYFEFRPFCPEVAIGLGIPRPTLHLIRNGQDIRCVGVKDQGHDVTEALRDYAAQQQGAFADLCGYILKKDSPSCGMERVRVYRGDYPTRTGTGVFAAFLQSEFPYLPLEEEGRLGDPALRENFIQRVFVLQRWRSLAKPITPHALMQFHSQHKLIAMSHNQTLARDLGRLVAGATPQTIEAVSERYLQDLMNCLKHIATRSNHVNVLQHIQGYLKRALEADDKQELIEVIEDYRLGHLPLLVPITLLKHHFRRAPDPFIAQSYYMQPYPDALAMAQDELARHP